MACGGAWRNGGNPAVPALNLVPDELKEKRREDRRRRQGILAGCLVGLMLLQLLAGFGWSLHRRYSQLETTGERLRRLGPRAARIRKIRERRRKIEVNLDRLENRAGEGLQLIPVFTALSELPESLAGGTHLTRVKLRTGEKGNLLQVAGETRDYGSASRLYDWIASRALVAKQTDRRQSSVDRRKGQRVRFRADFKLTSEGPAGPGDEP